MTGSLGRLVADAPVLVNCRRCGRRFGPDHFDGDRHQPTSDHLRRTPLERWHAKVEVNPDGCWLWRGTRDSLGYGGFWDGERRTRAHRAGYRLLVGPIPDGMELDHLCRVPECVNPAHLEPVTHAVNVRRGTAREAAMAAKAAITHCPQGHAYNAENTGVRPQGWRRCRACDRDYYHRKKAAG